MAQNQIDLGNDEISRVLRSIVDSDGPASANASELVGEAIGALSDWLVERGWPSPLHTLVCVRAHSMVQRSKLEMNIPVIGRSSISVWAGSHSCEGGGTYATPGARGKSADAGVGCS
jgi:hypothetical protein